MYADNKGTKKSEVRNAVLDLLKKSMGFNMNPNYVISDNNRTYPLQGIAKRNKEAERLSENDYRDYKKRQGL